MHYTGARLVWICRIILEGQDGEVIVQRDENRLLEAVRSLKVDKAKPSNQRHASDLDSTVVFFEN